MTFLDIPVVFTLSTKLFALSSPSTTAEPNDAVADLNALKGKHSHGHVFSFKIH